MSGTPRSTSQVWVDLVLYGTLRDAVHFLLVPLLLVPLTRILLKKHTLKNESLRIGTRCLAAEVDLQVWVDLVLYGTLGRSSARLLGRRGTTKLSAQNLLSS